jgi:hypothetical protein
MKGNVADTPFTVYPIYAASKVTSLPDQNVSNWIES